jgi:hypothetical protein
MVEPLVVVAPWWRVRRWDGTEKGAEPYIKVVDGVERTIGAPKQWEVIPLSAALATAYDTDAMMTGVRLAGEARMPLLTGKAVEREPCSTATTDILIFDVDPPKGATSEAFKAHAHEIVSDVAFDEDIGWWETMRGMRVIIWLDRPVSAAEYPRIWWGYRNWLLERKIVVDEGAKDFVHVFRLPSVYRDDQKHKGPLVGEWEMPGRQLPWIWGSPLKRLLARAPWEVCRH